jgi:hypothetical protein
MKLFLLTMVVALNACSVPDGKRAAGKPKNADHGVAKILFLNGEVRLKRAFNPSWRPLLRETSLKKGDQLFTGPTGSVHIEYFGKAASISFGPYTHFTINETPPSFTAYRRNFGAESGKSAGGRSQLANAKTVALKKDGRTLPQNRAQLAATGASGLSMMRDTGLIPVLFPQGDVILQSRTFPTSLAIRLEASLNQTAMWGFLWKKDEEATPVWSGFSLGSFAAIPIPSAGSFVLQIVSDDESQTTKPILITAEKRKTLTMPPLDMKPSIQTPVSVVFQ